MLGVCEFFAEKFGIFFLLGGSKTGPIFGNEQILSPQMPIFNTSEMGKRQKKKNPKSPILEHFFQFRGVDFFEILQVIRGFYLLRILFLIFFLSWRESPGPLPQEPPQIFSSESAGKGEIFGVRCG